VCEDRVGRPRDRTLFRVIHEPDAKRPAAMPLRTVYLLVEHARLSVGDAQLLATTVERLSCEDRAAFLEAALGLWTHYGPKHLDLVVRGQGGLADLTVVRTPTAADPGAEVDAHSVVRTAAPG